MTAVARLQDQRVFIKSSPEMTGVGKDQNRQTHIHGVGLKSPLPCALGDPSAAWSCFKQRRLQCVNINNLRPSQTGANIKYAIYAKVDCLTAWISAIICGLME